MPEKQPLQALAPLQFIFEPKLAIFIGKLLEVEELGGCLHNREWGRHSVVNDNRDTTLAISVGAISFGGEYYRPLGFKRMNHSFFCSLVNMLLHT